MSEINYQLKSWGCETCVNNGETFMGSHCYNTVVSLLVHSTWVGLGRSPCPRAAVAVAGLLTFTLSVLEEDLDLLISRPIFSNRSISHPLYWFLLFIEEKHGFFSFFMDFVLRCWWWVYLVLALLVDMIVLSDAPFGYWECWKWNRLKLISCFFPSRNWQNNLN